MSNPSTIIPPGPLVVADGATPSFLIKPAVGYLIFSATVNGNMVSPFNNGDGTYTYTFPPVHGDQALVVILKTP